MKTIKLLILIISLTISCTCFCQEKLTYIGPSYSNIKKDLGPIYICDGIPFKKIQHIKPFINSNLIDTILIRKNAVLNHLGDTVHYGIIEFYTKDSINTGLKYILEKSNHWMYKHPLSALKINNSKTKWNKRIIRKLITLRAEDIIDINTIEPNSTRGPENGLIILKINN
ncbi:hypothetical protein [Marinifilum flexuosum]|uniref:hypothetical protein n=1 Tax=Marinifilum flexuosum TaxID=1117708 RepID=UPI00249063B2|nr:hypothetical protein [Marinifilum flexuosum]